MSKNVFVYKCPNCGGNVEYIDNKWHCKYCNNTYNALFKPKENNPLPNLDEEEYILFKYECKKCNNNYVSKIDNNAPCDKCGEKNIDGKKFVVNGIISCDILFDGARNEYALKIDKFKKLIDNNFNEINLIGNYIYCDLYNGCIKISYNNFSEKIIFVNLLIPNLETDDYKFMYELGNIGISNSKVLSLSKMNCEEEVIKNGSFIKNVESKDFKNEVINACVDNFCNKYGIQEKNKIKIEQNLHIKNGFLIPVYTNVVEINNQKYYQHIIGNKYISKKEKKYFTNNKKIDRTFFSFPTIEDAIAKYRKSAFLNKIIKILLTVCIIPVLLLLFLVFNAFISISNIIPNNIINIISIIAIVSVLIYIILFILFFKTSKKKAFYYNSIKLSKDDYYKQIINNSNYVKIIKVKR